MHPTNKCIYTIYIFPTFQLKSACSIKEDGYPKFLKRCKMGATCSKGPVEKDIEVVIFGNTVREYEISAKFCTIEEAETNEEFPFWLTTFSAPEKPDKGLMG